MKENRKKQIKMATVAVALPTMLSVTMLGQGSKPALASNTNESSMRKTAALNAEASKIKAPVVSDVFEKQKEIKVQVDPTAFVVANFPDGTKVKEFVSTKNGDWTIQVPKNVTLKTGDVIRFSQELGNKKSPVTTVTVKAKNTEVQKPNAPVVNKVAADSTEITGTGEVGNKITVELPSGRTLSTNVNEYGSWSIKLEKGVIREGFVLAVTQTNADGVTSAKTKLVTLLAKPMVNKVEASDRTLTGKGTMFATVKVTFANGQVATSEVDMNGVWTVSVPTSVNLLEGDKITVTQSTPENGKSLAAEITVQAFTYKVKAPRVSEVVAGSREIKLKAEPALFVIVVFPDGTKVRELVTTRNGDWKISVPKNVVLKSGDTIIVSQECADETLVDTKVIVK